MRLQLPPGQVAPSPANIYSGSVPAAPALTHRKLRAGPARGSQEDASSVAGRSQATSRCEESPPLSAPQLWTQLLPGAALCPRPWLFLDDVRWLPEWTVPWGTGGHQDTVRKAGRILPKADSAGGSGLSRTEIYLNDH